jgi:hypothetical protein
VLSWHCLPTFSQDKNTTVSYSIHHGKVDVQSRCDLSCPGNWPVVWCVTDCHTKDLALLSLPH